MVLRIALFVLWLTTNSLSASLHKSRHDPKHSRASRKRQSSFLPSFNRDTAVCMRCQLPPKLLTGPTQLAAQAATRQKFRNAPALLVGYGISPGYTIPSSLQSAYDRASDYATNISLLSSRLMTPANSRFTSSPAIRVASAGTPGGANNVTSIPLSDDTDNTDDFEYYGPLLFGSQGQPVGIDFDTGSAGRTFLVGVDELANLSTTDLWIPVDCDCGNIKSFEANKSTTYRNTGQSFQVTYVSSIRLPRVTPRDSPPFDRDRDTCLENSPKTRSRWGLTRCPISTLARSRPSPKTLRMHPTMDWRAWHLARSRIRKSRRYSRIWYHSRSWWRLCSVSI